MAVTLFMQVPGTSLERYDRTIAGLGLDASPPIGEIVHIAAEAPDGGVDVCDVWQTRETAVSFVETRLKPALRDEGVTGEISYRIEPLHNLFAPDIDAVERIGSVSLPGQLARLTLA